MKIWQIDFREGKTFKDNFGNCWEVKNSDYYTYFINESEEEITDCYVLKKILEMDFKEVK